MLRELLARFDIDASDAIKGIKNVDKHLEGAKNALGGLADAFVGSAFVHGLKEFVERQIEAGSAVNDLSEKLGVGTDELQQFQFAAKLVGVEAEGAATGLGFLNKNIGMALEGNKEAVETFAKLGVSIRGSDGKVRELGAVLPEIADAFEGMGSAQERTAAAMKIFGKQGAALIPLLKDGSAGLKTMAAEYDRLGGGMDEGFIRSADAAGDEIDKLKFAMQGWKSQIAFAILPTVTKLAQHLQGWVGTFRHVTRETNLAKEAWVVFGAASAAASFKAAAGFAKFLGVLPKEASFWKTILGLGEIGLIIAGVVLLALFFEDFFGMLAGNESLIGEIIDEFLGVGTTTELVKQLTGAWGILSGLFADDLNQLKPLLDIFKDLGKNAIPYAVASFVDMVKVIAGLVVLFGAFIKALAQLATFDFDGVAKTIKATGTLFTKDGLLGSSAVGNLQLRNAQKESHRPDVTETLTRVPGRAGAERISLDQVNHINVEVQGGKNPEETGTAVTGGVEDALDRVYGDAFAASVTGG